VPFEHGIARSAHHSRDVTAPHPRIMPSALEHQLMLGI
jgi:hypothetical protein